jgi:hypothetical protein
MKIALLASLFLFFFLNTEAQSLNNTSWKGYFGGPVKDSLVYAFKRDSCVVTNSKGQIVIQSKMLYKEDTLTFIDVNGIYQCGKKGKYLFKISRNRLHYTLVEDACPPRNEITRISWVKITNSPGSL